MLELAPHDCLFRVTLSNNRVSGHCLLVMDGLSALKTDLYEVINPRSLIYSGDLETDWTILVISPPYFSKGPRCYGLGIIVDAPECQALRIGAGLGTQAHRCIQYRTSQFLWSFPAV